MQPAPDTRPSLLVRIRDSACRTPTPPTSPRNSSSRLPAPSAPWTTTRAAAPSAAGEARAARAASWDQDCDRRVFAWAADRVRVDFRPNTWQAFWLTAVEGLSTEEAARRLGLSLGAVQVARSRVLARLKETVRPLLEE
jgi:RNA polymerase sigma-70 factor (ECF subfamily)